MTSRRHNQSLRWWSLYHGIPGTGLGRELINQSAVNVPICINLARFANYLAQDFAKKWRTIDETNPPADISVNINSREYSGERFRCVRKF